MSDERYRDIEREAPRAEADQNLEDQADDLANDFNEEAAAEVATPTFGNRDRNETEQRRTMDNDVDDGTVGRGVGITALILSICSLFFLPIILGAAGLIIGFMAARRGARGLGYWSMGIGAASIIMTVFFAPFM